MTTAHDDNSLVPSLAKGHHHHLYPFSVHVVTFTFHYQLMHLLIKTLSQFTFKTTHVKNVCDA